ncbi:hypothetical protein R3P38DRAFT_3229648 [Favolaschia claudopus]|uniref:Uncharacterized protein n=1 Tax=Favolaschia claudopus TaxID=2862362 RepID=A0AAV9ZNZ5_9AGAR
MALVARASLIPLDNFLGTWLIGLILSSVLFGVTCLQIFLYFTKYCSRDRGILKIFVLFLFALDAFHLALVSHSLYSVVVTNFGDYVQLGIAPWSLLGSVAPSTLDHVPLNSRDHVREQLYAGNHAMVTIPSYPAATNDIENGTNSDTKVSGGRSGVEFTDSTR